MVGERQNYCRWNQEAAALRLTFICSPNGGSKYLDINNSVRTLAHGLGNASALRQIKVAIPTTVEPLYKHPVHKHNLDIGIALPVYAFDRRRILVAIGK